MFHVSLTDPGALPLLMMHKEWLLIQIEKLGEIPEYNEILLIDTTPPEPPQSQAGTSKDTTQSSAQEGPPFKRTRGKGARPKVVGSDPKKEGKQPTVTERLRGIGQAQAEVYNLSDLKQVVELSDYLAKNGGWELFTTPKNGQCVFASFIRGLDVPEEYRASHLRYQFGYFCVQEHAFCFNRLKLAIQAEYGHPRLSREEYLRRSTSEEDPLTNQEIQDYQKPGPFTFVQYLKYMMEDSSWGDEGIITLIGMMWNVTITVILVSSKSPKKDKPHQFRQLKLRHDRQLEDVDLVLIYAGESHYLGACKYLFSLTFSFRGVVTGTVQRSCL